MAAMMHMTNTAVPVNMDMALRDWGSKFSLALTSCSVPSAYPSQMCRDS